VLGVCHAWRPPHGVTEAALQAVHTQQAQPENTGRCYEGQRHSILHCQQLAVCVSALCYLLVD
jgi:hypothetical protein